MISIRASAERVRERIARACASVGRAPDDVTLVAVTKGFSADAIAAAADAGIWDVGENRAQELLEKFSRVAQISGYSRVLPIRWHFIGHLQSNKVKYIAPFIHCIHSIDSVRILDVVDTEARKNGRIVDILIEVNVSGEPQKYGAAPGETRAIALGAASLSNVRAIGLMTVAQQTANAAALQSQFAALRRLRDALRGECIAHAPMTELSMGMSNDFELAIAEGATMVRLGKALFGERTHGAIAP